MEKINTSKIKTKPSVQQRPSKHFLAKMNDDIFPSKRRVLAVLCIPNAAPPYAHFIFSHERLQNNKTPGSFLARVRPLLVNPLPLAIYSHNARSIIQRHVAARRLRSGRLQAFPPPPESQASSGDLRTAVSASSDRGSGNTGAPLRSGLIRKALALTGDIKSLKL